MQIRAQRPMDPAMPLLSRALLVGLLVSLTAMLPAGAAMPEPQSPFEPTGRWMLELDGEPVAADILYSERDVCFVVRSAALDRPLLLDVRDRSFTEISPSRLEPRPDGLIRLGSADPEDESHRRGTFVEGGSDYRFDFDDRAVRIAPKPHLAGPQSVGDMRGHNPKIALPTRKFRMKSNSTGRLRELDYPVRVQVFFGSWSTMSDRVLPRLFELEQALSDTSFSFDYYALPKPMDRDPTAQAMRIRTAPLAVVYVDGEEVGRLRPLELQHPAQALERLFFPAP